MLKQLPWLFASTVPNLLFLPLSGGINCGEVLPLSSGSEYKLFQKREIGNCGHFCKFDFYANHLNFYFVNKSVVLSMN